MPTPTAGKAKRGIHGSARKPGPIGIEFDKLLEDHGYWEYAFFNLDPTSTDWIEVVPDRGNPSGVFYRVAIVDHTKPDAPLLIDPKIREFRLKPIKESILKPEEVDVGSTSSKLYLEFGVFEQKRDRFIAFVSGATMVSVISVRPRSGYVSLAAFKPKYDEFSRLIASTGSRNAAFREFVSRYAPPIPNHASTHFEGKRGKTVEHEVHHLRYSQEKAKVLLENMVGALKSEGKKSTGTKALPRIRKLVEGSVLGWDSDQNDAFHRKIVEHDCLVMIAIYEAFALSREEARAAGNNEPLVNLHEILEPLTLDMMSKIGEPIETWGD